MAAWRICVGGIVKYKSSVELTLEAIHYKYAAGVALPTQETLKTPEPGSNALSKAMQRHTKSHRARYCASRFPM